MMFPAFQSMGPPTAPKLMALPFRKRAKTDFIPNSTPVVSLAQFGSHVHQLSNRRWPESRVGVGWFILLNMAASVHFAGIWGMDIKKWQIPDECLERHWWHHIHWTFMTTSYHMPDMKVGLYLRGLSNRLDFSWFSSFHFLGGTLVFNVLSPAWSFPCRGYRHICFIFCCTNYEERMGQKKLSEQLQWPLWGVP